MKNFTQNFFTEMRDFFLGRTTWEFVIIVLTNLYNFNIPPSWHFDTNNCAGSKTDLQVAVTFSSREVK